MPQNKAEAPSTGQLLTQRQYLQHTSVSSLRQPPMPQPTPFTRVSQPLVEHFQEAIDATMGGKGQGSQLSFPPAS